MARKRVGAILTSAMNAESIEQEEAAIEASKGPRRASSPVYANPAVALAKQSIAGESQETTARIPSNQSRMSPISDRSEPGADLEELIESIRTDGQQVPIMCRRLPDGELEVVYGRRRLLACQALKRDVRTSIKTMTDEEAIIAQGLENNARENTSFIEKALFIMRILGNGHKAVTVHKATGVNETTISKMKTIINEIPEDLIMKIGPAHGTGRPQWETLKTLCKKKGAARAISLVTEIPDELSSVDRLSFAITALKGAREAPRKENPGRAPVTTKVRGTKMTLVADESHKGFFTYLNEEIPKLIEAWKKDNE